MGRCGQLPPTPTSFQETPGFLPIVHEVLAEYAWQDPDVNAQAAAMASTGGSRLGSGGAFLPSATHRGRRALQGGGGAGAGAGGAGFGGWIRSLPCPEESGLDEAGRHR